MAKGVSDFNRFPEPITGWEIKLYHPAVVVGEGMLEKQSWCTLVV